MLHRVPPFVFSNDRKINKDDARPRDGEIMFTEQYLKLGKECQNALKQSERAAKRGDHRESARWIQIAERQAQVVERLQASGMQEDPEATERLREEVRERLARFIDLGMEEKAWYDERETWCDEVVRCYHAGDPMPAPMRPCPVSQAQLQFVLTAEMERVRAGDVS